MLEKNHIHNSSCGCKNSKGELLYVPVADAKTQKALDYCEKNIQKSVDELIRLVKIPSVSLASFDSNQMKLSAEAVAESLQNSGLEKVQVIQFGDVHPYVYGEWLHKPDAPTLLLYAHHDVQPPGVSSKWKSDPFIPTESQGRLYGRGCGDDKAGIIAHVAAIAAYLNTVGELPVNVKVLIEGEEEIGSEHLGQFVKGYKNLLQADAMILTDCANIESGVPSITTALRGLVAIDLELESAAHSVHSGLWGGILPDPVAALAHIIAQIMEPNGRMKIPGIYDDVRPLSDANRLRLEELRMGNIARKATSLHAELPFTTDEKNFASRLWHEPAMSINAIQSGSRSMVSNIIQDGAWARVSIRIVPNMKPEKILQQLTQYIQACCPPGFRLKITTEAAAGWWSLADPSAEIYQIAARSLEKGYGRRAEFIGCGASIPFVQPLSEELGGIPAILVGVEDPYTNAHSENESLLLSDFRKTLLGQIHMFADLARYKRK